MVKVGYKGKVKKGNTVIAGMTSWSYSGTVRGMEDDSEFGNEHKTFVGTQLEGGEIAISGNFLLDTDTGQQLLRTAIMDDEQWADLRLYIDESDELYYTPDNTTTPASYVSVTKFDDVAHSKAGLMSFTATFKVSGTLKLNKSSTEPGIETIGAIDIDTNSANMIGVLTGMGAEASLDCYFEYGLTTTYGSNSKGDAITMTSTGIFDVDTGNILASGTTYHYRAVAEDVDENKWYGSDKTLTTE